MSSMASARMVASTGAWATFLDNEGGSYQGGRASP